MRFHKKPNKTERSPQSTYIQYLNTDLEYLMKILSEKLWKSGNSTACMMQKLSCIYSLGILKPSCTGGGGGGYRPVCPRGGGINVFDTWLVLDSLLCPRDGGPWFQVTETLAY